MIKRKVILLYFVCYVGRVKNVEIFFEKVKLSKKKLFVLVYLYEWIVLRLVFVRYKRIYCVMLLLII